MKKIDDVIKNYDKYETYVEDRFGIRFIEFLTSEQAKEIGFEIKEKFVNEHNKNIKKWNRENILEQLKKDVKFGWEKACDERGISSSLMYHVVLSWNKILEEGLEDWDEDNYAMYGKPLFKATAEKYGWNLDDE